MCMKLCIYVGKNKVAYKVGSNEMTQALPQGSGKFVSQPRTVVLFLLPKTVLGG